jgi:hypothetical protein
LAVPEKGKDWQKENNIGHNLASTGGSILDANPGSVLSAN